MTTRWQPERQTTRIRNGTVAAVTGATVTLNLDGNFQAGVPVHGPMPAAGRKVLVFEQGHSLLVLGEAVSELAVLRSEVTELRGMVQALLERGGWDG
jgi:hypothetical protein